MRFLPKMVKKFFICQEIELPLQCKNKKLLFPSALQGAMKE